MPDVHASAVILEGAGLLLTGPSGAGKSDLALRLLEAGGRLIADDVVHLEREGPALIASAPARLKGLLEVRGIGPLRVASAGPARLAAVLELVAADAVRRLPEPESIDLAGIVLPRYRLAPFEASAPAKARLLARLALGLLAPP